MAGSWDHLRNEVGAFTFERIDHLGDAEEACEQMFHMIDRLVLAIGILSQGEFAGSEVIADAQRVAFEQTYGPALYRGACRINYPDRTVTYPNAGPPEDMR